MKKKLGQWDIAEGIKNGSPRLKSIPIDIILEMYKSYTRFCFNELFEKKYLWIHHIGKISVSDKHVRKFKLGKKFIECDTVSGTIILSNKLKNKIKGRS